MLAMVSPSCIFYHNYPCKVLFVRSLKELRIFFSSEVTKVSSMVHVHLRRDLYSGIQLSGPGVLCDISSSTFSLLDLLQQYFFFFF